jgi:hypothetical protein
MIDKEVAMVVLQGVSSGRGSGEKARRCCYQCPSRIFSTSIAVVISSETTCDIYYSEFYCYRAASSSHR